MPAFRDLTGRRFGRLTVLKRFPPRKWVCRCDCGKEKAVFACHLIHGTSRSCGCLQSEMRKANGYRRDKVAERCPCCGQPATRIGITGKMMREAVRLSVMEQALFNNVKRAKEGISVVALREQLGVEHYSGQYIAVTAHHANKKIAAWGLKITASGGPGSMYYLVQL